MSIYQFLIAVRQRDGEMLMNEAGETTRYGTHSLFPFLSCPYPAPSVMRNVWRHSHLMGLFYRTIRIVENGIKPAYVFDGKPPELKAGVVRVVLYPF
jgi:flap endonuclease-1